MADRDRDLEFLPSDELVEDEPAGAEDEAVHVQVPGEPRELMTVEADEFDADGIDEDEADELELEENERDEGGAAGAEPAAGAGGDEHEEDVQEVVHRHYGLVSEEPDEDLATGRDGLSPPAARAFICVSCLLRKPVTQMSGTTPDTCVDCAADG